MKILVTGANGFVGRGLIPRLRGRGHEVFAFGFGAGLPPGIRSIDLTDGTAAEEGFLSLAPTHVIHLAGLKNVTLCERDRELSMLLNVTLTINVASASTRVGAKLVFISTDYVFDGRGGPYAEDSPPHPGTQYGRDKLRAEDFLRERVEDHCIVRTSGLFGVRGDFVDVVRGSLRKGMPFDAFNDLVNNPTFIGDFADMILAVIERDAIGTLHCCGRESLSRFDFARKIASVFSLEESLIRSAALDARSDIRPPRLEMDGRETCRSLGVHPDRIESTLVKHRRIWET